jgi:hypothetical protein
VNGGTGIRNKKQKIRNKEVWEPACLVARRDSHSQRESVSRKAGKRAKAQRYLLRRKSGEFHAKTQRGIDAKPARLNAVRTGCKEAKVCAALARRVMDCMDPI